MKIEEGGRNLRSVEDCSNIKTEEKGEERTRGGDCLLLQVETTMINGPWGRAEFAAAAAAAFSFATPLLLPSDLLGRE